MFSKRKKKTFPPGTFIPTQARVLAILQLCLAFSVILWCFGIPFMGELFSYKSKLLLYQNVMGDRTLLSKLDEAKAEQMKSKFERQAQRFRELPLEKKEILLKNYQHLQNRLEVPFWTKFKKSWRILLLEISPYLLAWVFFSIVLSLMLLKRIEGALQALWILPIIAVAYAADNYWYGSDLRFQSESNLFPKEQVIVEHYLKEPLSSNIEVQREQLLTGWNMYLVREWAKEEPAADKEQFNMQIEKGEFAFNLARLELETDESMNVRKKENIFFLSCYIVWNLLFAWCVWRKCVLSEVCV